jgi:hypothetical protein
MPRTARTPADPARPAPDAVPRRAPEPDAPEPDAPEADTPEQEEAPPPETLVETRVLRATAGFTVDNIVLLTGPQAEAAVADGWGDPHPDAVAAVRVLARVVAD